MREAFSLEPETRGSAITTETHKHFKRTSAKDRKSHQRKKMSKRLHLPHRRKAKMSASSITSCWPFQRLICRKQAGHRQVEQAARQNNGWSPSLCHNSAKSFGCFPTDVTAQSFSICSPGPPHRHRRSSNIQSGPLSACLDVKQTSINNQ